MAKPLTVEYGGEMVELGLEKIDRSDLYGQVRVEATDAEGRPVTLMTLDGDGHTLIGSGGTAFVYLDSERRWRDRSTLRRVTVEGEPLEPVPSSFSAPIDLTTTVSVVEYLSHNIRAIYALTPHTMPAPLASELAKGTIFAFPFSYRGGVDPDTGFLLNNADGEPFLALGRPTTFEFIGFEQAVLPTEDTDDDLETDEIDFGMI